MMPIARTQTSNSGERKHYTYHFDGFALSTSPLRLRRDGYDIEIRPQANRLLALLLENIGEPVTTGQICARLWPNAAETDCAGAIRVAMVHLRQALGDSARRPNYIETVTGVGYRFIHPVAAEEAPLLTIHRVR